VLSIEDKERTTCRNKRNASCPWRIAELSVFLSRKYNIAGNRAVPGGEVIGDVIGP
jgi:hypothetical protein